MDKQHHKKNTQSDEALHSQEPVADCPRSAGRRVVVAGGLVASGLAVLPQTWSRPLVNSVVLPAHAQTSECVLPPVRPPEVVPPPGTTVPPGTTSPPTAGILVCDANGKNCEFQATTLCGASYSIGEIYANDAVRVTLRGFPPDTPIDVDTSSGNHSCNDCPATTNGVGYANLLFSTGNKGDHLTIVTVDTCVVTVNWTSVSPGGNSRTRSGLPFC